jgi:hypothetical protein
MALAPRKVARKAKFQLLDITVKPGADPDSATATMTLLGDVNDEKNFISQELKVSFRKTEGVWLITHVETVKTLG